MSCLIKDEIYWTTFCYIGIKESNDPSSKAIIRVVHRLRFRTPFCAMVTGKNNLITQQQRRQDVIACPHDQIQLVVTFRHFTNTTAMKTLS